MVSISVPIVRGKIKAMVEFGAKFDLLLNQQTLIVAQSYELFMINSFMRLSGFLGSFT